MEGRFLKLVLQVTWTMTDIYEGMVLIMLTIGGDCTGQDIGKILTERERQVITQTKFFGIDYICCMNTFLGSIEDNEKYKVVKIFRVSRRQEVLERNLTREEAKRVVNRYPDSNRSMVVFMKQ